MAIFEGWGKRIGETLFGLPGVGAILLRNADNTPDMLMGNGAGAALTSDATAQASLASILAGMATATLQAALNALVSTPGTPTPILKSDDTDTTAATLKGVWVGGAGDLIVKGVAGGDVRTFKVAACSYVPCQASRVMAATTATDLVGLS